MSMNKMFKKVLAVVAAGAMTMGMAMPTFAADPGKTTEAWITKTYKTEAGKAEKFSFTAEQVKTGTGIITTDAAVTMPEISFTDTETGTMLWSSIFVTLMANKIGGLQFGIYRNCQISSRVFHTAVAALPLTKANRSDFE